MGAAKVVSVLYLFFFLLFLILVFACCTVCVVPAGRIAQMQSDERRGRRRSRVRSIEGDRTGLVTEEVDAVAGPSVTVTTQPISASPMVVPPYPVEPLHPTPQVPPAPGFAASQPPYPTQNPHPLGGPFAYPPPMGNVPYPQPAAAPYPPASTPYPPTGPPVPSSAPYPDYSAQPPSYSEAVAQPPVQPPLPHKEGYSKQSPYNPNY